MSRLKLIKDILFSERLLAYAEILRLLRENDYTSITLSAWAQGSIPQKFVILRHDIDLNDQLTRRMFTLETQYGMKASYYFRKSTFDLPLMREIETYGSEASFHYETVSDYVIKNRIVSFKQLQESNYVADCLLTLKNDLTKLRRHGFKCETIAGHGHRKCDELGFANYFFLWNKDYYLPLDITLEAYNKEFVAALDTYYTDFPLQINRGWRYEKNLLQDLQNGKAKNKILFLSHPSNWGFSFPEGIKQILKIALKGELTVKSEFNLE